MLAAPVGALRFAGEATSAEAPATAHGALLSGIRAADEIAEQIGGDAETVLVVGAGLAGLAAARALLDYGYQVVVVEGRDRLGGRTHTIDLDGYPADLGASWIHGVEGNPLVDLARDAGSAPLAFDYDNEVGAPEDAEQYLDELYAAAEDSEDPEHTALSTLVAALAPEGADSVTSWLLATEVAAEFGADPEQLAVAALDEGADMEGGDAVLARGYQPLVDSFADGPRRSSRLGSSHRRVGG